MPKKNKQLTVLIDTVFLVMIFDQSRPEHAIAEKYYRYFIEHGIAMKLSSVVVAEYSVKANINDILATGNFMLCDLSTLDGITAGKFTNTVTAADKDGQSRDAVKDDIKILAQCANNDIDFLATFDNRTMAKYLGRLEAAGEIKTKLIDTDKFDTSIFNDGQTNLLDVE